MRTTITVTKKDNNYNEMMNVAEKALTPENLRIVARGGKNKKSAIDGTEKNGITFYIAGIADADSDQRATVYKGKASLEDLNNAMRNTVKDARIGGMMEIMFGGGGQTIRGWKPDGDMMFVLTNTAKYMGAGVIYCDEVLKAIHKKLGDFFILPSSIHEVIIVPADNGINKTGLTEMVKSINAGVVLEDEQLSDEAFLYDGNDWA